MKRIGSCINITSVYIGTILGAGFASGQELLSFFAVYGIEGMFGFLLSGMLFGILLYIILTIVYCEGCNHFKDLSKRLFSPKISFFLEITVTLFMFVIFCTMLAGSGALVSQRFGISRWIGVCVMAAGCFIVYCYEVKGVVLVNSFLAPILLIGSIIIGVYLWVFRSIDVSHMIDAGLHTVKDNWVFSSVIYVAYNIITAVVVVSSLGKVILDKSVIFLSSFLSGVILALIGLCLGTILLINYNSIIGVDIPLLTIVLKYHTVIQYTYMIVLFSAMFTTAIAAGFGVLQWLNSKKRYNDKGIILVMIAIGMFMSNLGFSNLVKNIYPIFGYIGAFEIIVIVLYYINKRKAYGKKR